MCYVSEIGSAYKWLCRHSKNGLFYIHSDHLGSNSFMTKADGTLVAGSASRYTPFGDWRTEPTVRLTDIGYTGHRHNNLADNDLGWFICRRGIMYRR